ncbi:hypothetical protein [Pseudomonas putida]|uniref:hypothetical protein n=1 Tax=Pseudomonas putida TaxID=303 RepID=UPI0015C34E66|nr:hypothetical protein [Pseudomonas putida]
MRLLIAGQGHTSFINFGAFLGFTAVNLCVICYFYRTCRTRRLRLFGYLLARCSVCV